LRRREVPYNNIHGAGANVWGYQGDKAPAIREVDGVPEAGMKLVCSVPDFITDTEDPHGDPLLPD